MAPQGQAVRFRDCTCPDTPHNGRDGADDGDIVIMRDHLGFIAGMEAARAMAEAMKHVDLTGWVPDPKAKVPEHISRQLSELSFQYLAPVYLREGPIDWNVLDENGPVEMTRDRLSDLPYSQGLPIGQKGDELYSDEVASPLVKRTSGSQRGIPTNSKTSRKTRSSSPRRSSQSSSSGSASGGVPSAVSP